MGASLCHRLSAGAAGLGAPGWLPLGAGTWVLGARPGPWAQNVHSCPRAALAFSPPGGCVPGASVPRDRKWQGLFRRPGPRDWHSPVSTVFICQTVTRQSQGEGRPALPLTGGGSKNLRPTEGPRQDELLGAPAAPAGCSPVALVRLDGMRSMWWVGGRAPRIKLQPALAWERKGVSPCLACLAAPSADGPASGLSSLHPLCP